MTTYTCKLDLNDAEIRMITAALEAYIREYDKKNLLQPWNTEFKDLAKTVKKRIQSRVVTVGPAAPEGSTLETERPTSRPHLSAHFRHNAKRRKK